MSTRQMGATVLALVAGAAGFGGLLLAGYLLYVRLWGDSPTALVVIILLFGTAGLYAGWILGMLVFSAVRGPGDEGGAAA
ncbi:MAG: hypothetical protein AUI15_33450 [Actinobacteria bacterium 13_2_20CM_2_66_6]|nr:MAG: hypothetical protein AUI15_33450 [Actinobacteria bacterium 13_2_20CM_2_66_6]